MFVSAFSVRNGSAGAYFGLVHANSMNFRQFYGNFYVEVGKFSGPKLEGKNTTA